MEKLCVLCGCSISKRHHLAKFCFPCAELTSKRNGGSKAAYAVRKAIKNGDLKSPKEFDCVDCGAPAFCYDHRDYNKPLDVDPVCSSCNKLRGSAIPLEGQENVKLKKRKKKIYSPDLSIFTNLL